MGSHLKEVDFAQFRRDQEASIRSKGYTRFQLTYTVHMALMDIYIALGAHRENVDADTYSETYTDYIYRKDEYQELKAKGERDESGGLEATAGKEFNELISVLVRAREMKVVMNRADGNYHIPTDYPEKEPKPVDPVPDPRSSE